MMITHKKNERAATPLVSIILLDWSVRENFQALEWLNRQQAPRDSFELIWVELHDRVAPQAMDMADVVMTLGQRGMYHKHKAYNAGLLASRGQIICICDSDAVFDARFIDSIKDRFSDGQDGLKPLVLMHYEWRTTATYPDDLESQEDLAKYTWLDLWPNVGACMTVRKQDAIRYGGFDEHRSYRGYICGPYDLAWRLVNAGVPEVWEDPSIALWHFAHPDPPASLLGSFSLKRWLEVRTPHIKYHALAAVEAFSSGAMLPRKENMEIFKHRMAERSIGTPYEEEYAALCGPQGFSMAYWMRKRAMLVVEGLARMILPYYRWARRLASRSVKWFLRRSIALAKKVLRGLGFRRRVKS